MKLVIQRVKEASVAVGGSVISQIRQGLLLLVGIHEDDTSAEAQFLAKKVLTLKLWNGDDDRPWQKSVIDNGYEVLSVSNFTLYGHMQKPRPDFHRSMKSEQSRVLYDEFLALLGKNYSPDRIFNGEFGAMMDVNLVNDGPITLLLDSADFPGAVDNFRLKEPSKSPRPKEASPPATKPSPSPSPSPLPSPSEI